MPFQLDLAPVWSDVRKLPLAEQEVALRNPETRRRLVEAGHPVHVLYVSGHRLDVNDPADLRDAVEFDCGANAPADAATIP